MMNIKPWTGDDHTTTTQPDSCPLSHNLIFLFSHQHLPTVTISEQADVLAEVANQSLSVPLFTPHKGRLVEATESNIKAAESKCMIVSLPTLTQDCPLNKLNPDLHPITGMTERCAILYIFYFYNSKRGLHCH